MCGNCGWFTQQDTVLSASARRTLARVTDGLLVGNAARGTDATGVAVISREGISTIYKKAKPSFTFVDMPKARRVIRKDNAMMLLGHTRLGTMGANIDRNAHPFQEGTVVGTHNGIIWNHWELDSDVERQFPKASAVDSQAAFRMLAVAKDPTYALSKIEGQAALIWHDSREPDVLSMVRHNNPLSIAIVPRINTLFWSSQYDHLSAVLFAAYGGEWYSLSMPEDRLLRFHAKDLLNYETHEVTFQKPTYSGKYTSTGAWKGSGKWGGTSISTSPTSVSEVLAGIGDKKETEVDDETERSDLLAIDICELCENEIPRDDYYADFLDEEGVLACGDCASWWENEGKGNYSTVGAAADVKKWSRKAARETSLTVVPVT